VPTARVVAQTEARGAVPERHPVVTPAERRDQLARRSRAAQRRWS
jgi:hypothetical protein